MSKHQINALFKLTTTNFIITNYFYNKYYNYNEYYSKIFSEFFVQHLILRYSGLVGMQQGSF